MRLFLGHDTIKIIILPTLTLFMARIPPQSSMYCFRSRSRYSKTNVRDFSVCTMSCRVTEIKRTLEKSWDKIFSVKSSHQYCCALDPWAERLHGWPCKERLLRVPVWFLSTLRGCQSASTFLWRRSRRYPAISQKNYIEFRLVFIFISLLYCVAALFDPDNGTKRSISYHSCKCRPLPASCWPF